MKTISIVLAFFLVPPGRMVSTNDSTLPLTLRGEHPAQTLFMMVIE